MVSYKDDNGMKHLTFVKKYSEIKFFKNRFDEVSFEITKPFNKENIFEF